MSVDLILKLIGYNLYHLKELVMNKHIKYNMTTKF
jgi:hypothetical protein